MSKVQRTYGWRPSLPSIKAEHFKASDEHLRLAAAVTSVDLRSGMPAVWDQGQLGSCFSPDTEVLTKDGWALFSALTGQEELASVDPESQKLIFEKPTRLIAKHYNGDMYYGKHEALDFAVTADHTMVVRKWNEAKRTLDDGYSMVPMKDVGWYVGLMNSVSYDGEINVSHVTLKGVSSKVKAQREDVQIEMETWLKFLGIYLAEGTMLRSYVRNRTNNNGTIGVAERGANKIQIAAVKEREKAFVRDVLTRLGTTFLELPDRFTFQNKRIFSAMKSLGLFGVKAPRKFVPAFIFRLPSSQIGHFLEGHFNGDGCEQHGTRSHYTSSSRLANDLQRLIFLSGQWGDLHVRPPRRSQMKDGRIVIGKHPEHRVSVWGSRNLSISKRDNVNKTHYDGMVYCAEVPTYHTLVTRRNGKILIAGNCTAHAVSAAVEFLQKKIKPAWDFMPARLFIYYNERVIEGSVASDAGATIADSVNAIAKYGAPREDLWKYDITKFTRKPPVAAYKDAVKHECVKSALVNQDINSMKAVLAGGLPFIFGFTVYESFESDAVASTGIVPMPASNEQELGGHAVCCVGYDDAKKMILVRNSWGANWGVGGYFWMDYAYILDPNLASDIHVVQKLTN